MAEPQVPTAVRLESPDSAAEPDAKPFIPAEATLPELTVKALVLGALLAVVLGAANAYVGLKVGLTVAASIPASVLSMAILRAFKRSTILENNIVQTSASSGEAVAAGLVFTLPALVLLGLWNDFQILPTILIAAVGGVLGVMFTVPLRRAYVVETKLPFPEGVACAQVLESGARGGRGVKVLAGGILVGGSFTLMGLGMRLWHEVSEGAVRLGNSVAYLGTSLSPILLAVGAIVGLRIGFLIVLGSAIAWFVLIPVFLAGIPGVMAPFAVGGIPWYEAGLGPVAAAYAAWSGKIRIVGGGAMIVGGLYTLWLTRSSLRNALLGGRSGLARVNEAGEPAAVLRTEHDMPMRRVALSVALLVIPIFGLYYHFTGRIGLALVAAAVMAIAGFFFSAVAGYMAGVVGSSNNPVSGVTIVTLLGASLLLLASGASGEAGILGALGVGAVICVAAAMAGDTLQDLKTGHILGATPWKQQVAQIVGVTSFALVAPFVLILLHSAFGFASAENPTGLLAPQANLMRSILAGVFGQGLDWSLLLLGMGIATIFAIARLPVMAVAVGLYLPLSLTLPIFLGGAIAYAITRNADGHGFTRPDSGATNVDLRVTKETDDANKERKGRVKRTSILFASGLIAGEAIMGILLAFLIVFEADSASRVLTGSFAPLLLGLLAASGMLLLGERLKRLRIPAAVGLAVAGLAVSVYLWTTDAAYGFEPGASWPGLLVLAYVAWLIYYVPSRENEAEPEVGA